jgi:hypothetical protein
LSNLLQLAALGLAAAATVRYAGVNAGLLVIAAILFLIALALDGGEIQIAELARNGARRIGRVFQPIEDDPEDLD